MPRFIKLTLARRIGPSGRLYLARELVQPGSTQRESGAGPAPATAAMAPMPVMMAPMSVITVPVRVGGGAGIPEQSREFRESSAALYLTFGLVMLIGLITKNGILIVEFANRLRSRGYDPMAAVQEAAALRLRPTLMTTSAMILGALPLALTGGPGAESRAPICLVIVGWLSFGTLLTLFVIPTAYTLLTRREHAAEAEAYEPSPAPEPAALADRFRSPQSRPEWVQRR